MEMVLGKLNFQKVERIRKRNLKFTNSWDAANEKRHLRNSYLIELKLKSKSKLNEEYLKERQGMPKELNLNSNSIIQFNQENEEKINDYETKHITNQYRNAKRKSSTDYQDFRSIREVDHINPDNKYKPRPKEIRLKLKLKSRSKLTTSENKNLKEKINQFVNSSMKKYNYLEKTIIPILTEGQMDTIQNRINYSNENAQIANLNEREWQIIVLNQEEISFFSIFSKDKICPLKLKFFQIPLKHVNLYMSSSKKYPNSKIFQEKCEYIQSEVVYSFNFGQDELKKFKFEFIYLSLISKIPCKFKIIYSFNKEGLFPKINPSQKFHESFDSYINIGKASIDNLRISKNIFAMLFENEHLIKERKRKILLMNSNHEDLVKKNMNVMDYINRSILDRNSKSNLEKIKMRREIAKRKREQLLESKLVYNTLLIHRWKLRRKQNDILTSIQNTNNNIKSSKFNFILASEFMKFITIIFLFFQRIKEEKIIQIKKSTLVVLITWILRKKLIAKGRDLKERATINNKMNLIISFNSIKTCLKERQMAILLNVVDNSRIIFEMKIKFLYFFENASKIQKFVRELIFARQNEIELLTKLWNVKVGELYKSGQKKSKKHQLTIKRIISISDEFRNKTIKEYLYNKINEFTTNYKAWLKYLKSDKSLTMNAEKHKKKEKKHKSTNKKKKENIIVSEKPIFIFVPTPEKFNALILKASEKK